MTTMKIAIAMISLALCACATLSEKQPEQLEAAGVVYPNAVCAKRGNAIEVGKPGSSMHCELEETVGTHLPSCICRGAEQVAADRAAAADTVVRVSGAAPVMGSASPK
jgi:hypothetical protein